MLKRILVILISLQSAKAQTTVYHPFPDSAATWRERMWFVDGFTLHEHRYQLSTSGDTSIGTNNYHKIYITEEYNDYAYPQGYILNSWFLGTSFYGFLRQDTSSKRIYTYDLSNQSDTLLYDFNLQIGDTLPDSYNHSLASINPIVVGGIDSVLVGNDYRKRFLLAGYPSIIEGVGCASGLFYILDSWDVGGELNCFLVQDTFLYSDGSPDACELVDRIDGKQENSFVRFFPNPFHSSARLEIARSRAFSNQSDNYSCQLKIYNTIGCLVWEEGIGNIKSYVFFRNSLPNGLYFYELISLENELLANGKFILE